MNRASFYGGRLCCLLALWLRLRLMPISASNCSEHDRMRDLHYCSHCQQTQWMIGLRNDPERIMRCEKCGTETRPCVYTKTTGTIRHGIDDGPTA